MKAPTAAPTASPTAAPSAMKMGMVRNVLFYLGLPCRFRQLTKQHALQETQGMEPPRSPPNPLLRTVRRICVSLYRPHFPSANKTAPVPGNADELFSDVLPVSHSDKISPIKRIHLPRSHSDLVKLVLL